MICFFFLLFYFKAQYTIETAVSRTPLKDFDCSILSPKTAVTQFGDTTYSNNYASVKEQTDNKEVCMMKLQNSQSCRESRQDFINILYLNIDECAPSDDGVTVRCQAIKLSLAKPLESKYLLAQAIISLMRLGPLLALLYKPPT